MLNEIAYLWVTFHFNEVNIHGLNEVTDWLKNRIMRQNGLLIRTELQRNASLILGNIFKQVSLLFLLVFFAIASIESWYTFCSLLLRTSASVILIYNIVGLALLLLLLLLWACVSLAHTSGSTFIFSQWQCCYPTSCLQYTRTTRIQTERHFLFGFLILSSKSSVILSFLFIAPERNSVSVCVVGCFFWLLPANIRSWVVCYDSNYDSVEPMIFFSLKWTNVQ